MILSDRSSKRHVILIGTNNIKNRSKERSRDKVSEGRQLEALAVLPLHDWVEPRVYSAPKVGKSYNPTSSGERHNGSKSVMIDPEDCDDTALG